jgi:hypothetical protein
MYKWQEDGDSDHVIPAVKFHKDLLRVVEEKYDRR